MTTTTTDKATIRYAPFYRAESGQTTFLTERNYSKVWNLLEECKAARVYIYATIYDSLRFNKHPRADTLIPCGNPRLAFMQTLQADPDIPDAADEDIGDYNATNSIPASTRILQPTTIAHTTFGENCIVYPNVAIGFPAMAVERDEHNRLYDFPHIGRVIIGDNVVVDSTTSICRGSLDDTVIGNGCRVDNQVQIAHNCNIGYNTIITAGTIIGGSVTVGHDCWLGLNCTIMNSLKIANHVIVGQGANVINDIPDDYEIVAGNPARSIKSICKLSKEKRYMMRGERQDDEN